MLKYSIVLVIYNAQLINKFMNNFSFTDLMSFLCSQFGMHFCVKFETIELDFIFVTKTFAIFPT